MAEPTRSKSSHVSLSLACWLLLPLVGLVGGYYLAVIIGLTLYPGSNLGPLPFIFTVWPATFVGFTVLAVVLGRRFWKQRGD